MKRSIRTFAMALAAVMSISIMSISSLAAEPINDSMQIVPKGSDTAVTTQMYTPEIGDTILYTDSEGVQRSAVITMIDTPTPVTEFDVMPLWTSRNWFTQTRINRNLTGNEGTQKGSTYTATSYDGHAAFKTRNWSADLNALNYSLIDVEEGQATWGRIYTEYPNGINIHVPTAGHKYYYVFSGESTTNNPLYCDLFLYSDM